MSLSRLPGGAKPQHLMEVMGREGENPNDFKAYCILARDRAEKDGKLPMMVGFCLTKDKVHLKYFKSWKFQEVVNV